MLGAYSIMRSDSIISDHSDHNAPPGDPKGETSNPTEPTGQPRIKWTDEEAELLMSLRKQDEDMPWEEIQEKYFPDRTLGSLKSRFWRMTDAESKKRKRSPSPSSTNDGAAIGDIPFEHPHGSGKERPRLNPAGEVNLSFQKRTGLRQRPDSAKLSHTPRNSSRNPRLSESTAKRLDSGSQPRKLTRNSLPSAAPFSAPVNKPPIKRAPASSVQLPDNDPPILDSTDDGDNRVQLTLQLLDPKLWVQIYDEARKCEPERRRANSALRENAALKAEMKDLKSRLQKADRGVHRQKPKAQSSSHQRSPRELDTHRSQRLISAWNTVASTCKDSISFTNWEATGMSEAVKIVQSEIVEMTRSVESESPSSPIGPGIANGHEHDDDNGDSVMGNLHRLFEGA